MAQGVLPVQRLQRPPGGPALHLPGRRPLLHPLLQQPVRQEVLRLQHRHHRSVTLGGGASWGEGAGLSLNFGVFSLWRVEECVFIPDEDAPPSAEPPPT